MRSMLDNPLLCYWKTYYVHCHLTPYIPTPSGCIYMCALLHSHFILANKMQKNVALASTNDCTLSAVPVVHGLFLTLLCSSGGIMVSVHQCYIVIVTSYIAVAHHYGDVASHVDVPSDINVVGSHRNSEKKSQSWCPHYISVRVHVEVHTCI